MEVIITLIVITLFIVLVYGIQKRIGERQATEWEDYKKEHPELFPFKPTKGHVVSVMNMTDEQKKS